MELDELDPEFRAAMRWAPALPFGERRWQPLLQRVFGLLARSPLVAGVQTRDLSLGPGPSPSPVRLRVYTPSGQPSGAAMLWLHGGGLVVGTEKQDDRICSTYASELGLVVVSVGYRLAPQHPFPAASDDCLAAWRWVLDQAGELGVDPSRVVVAGDSAGGGLAASLAHRVHDEGGVQPVAQLLLEPMLDDRSAADPSLDRGYFGWRWKDNRGAWAAYLGHEPGREQVPAYAVPARRVELAGLPPAWIACGDKDLFYAEDQRYAARLREAGVAVEFVTVEGAPHGFHAFAPKAPKSRAVFEASRAWLAEVLALD